MTPEQIKQLTKQAGGFTYLNSKGSEHVYEFSKAAIDEFVRLVREQALNEAAKKCDELCGMLYCHGDKEGAEIAMSLRDSIKGFK